MGKPVRIYETEVMKSPLPVEDSVMRMLKTSLTHRLLSRNTRSF